MSAILTGSPSWSPHNPLCHLTATLHEMLRILQRVQVLNRLSAALAFITFAGVLIIFLVLLVGRNAGAGYSLVTAFVIFVSSVPIGIPVVTTTVLAVGARQMAKEKAIVARWAFLSLHGVPTGAWDAHTRRQSCHFSPDAATGLML